MFGDPNTARRLRDLETEVSRLRRMLRQTDVDSTMRLEHADGHGLMLSVQREEKLAAKVSSLTTVNGRYPAVLCDYTDTGASTAARWADTDYAVWLETPNGELLSQDVRYPCVEKGYDGDRRVLMLDAGSGTSQEFVLVTGETLFLGRYPGRVQIYDGSQPYGSRWTSGENVWLETPNGEFLSENYRYLAKRQDFDNGRQVYLTGRECCDENAGSGSGSAAWYCMEPPDEVVAECQGLTFGSNAGDGTLVGSNGTGVCACVDGVWVGGVGGVDSKTWTTNTCEGNQSVTLSCSGGNYLLTVGGGGGTVNIVSFTETPFALVADVTGANCGTGELGSYRVTITHPG